MFISIRDAEYQNNKDATLNSAIDVAKQTLPEMFPSQIKHTTFKRADKGQARGRRRKLKYRYEGEDVSLSTGKLTSASGASTEILGKA